ncbi:MAG: hypothetical protein HGB10_11560 [Coriobacteriia bacterium]|nr:hypothetical protein [Coriobacteriia bacterium]
MTSSVSVYLEVGNELTHATAVDWPGWSRSGRDEASALQTLFDFAPRYAAVLESQGLSFAPPARIADLTVLGRLPGSATSDFGIPASVLPGDELPLDAGQLAFGESVMKGCWWALDHAEAMATGQALRKGPRGGGRSLGGVIKHVREVELAYANAIGVKVLGDLREESAVRDELLCGLRAVVSGEIPAVGPRGGRRWSPRYFLRRLAWHELYHAWVTEDRIERP